MGLLGSSSNPTRPQPRQPTSRPQSAAATTSPRLQTLARVQSRQDARYAAGRRPPPPSLLPPEEMEQLVGVHHHHHSLSPRAPRTSTRPQPQPHRLLHHLPSNRFRDQLLWRGVRMGLLFLLKSVWILHGPVPKMPQVSRFGNRTARRSRHAPPGDAFAARPEPTVTRAFSEPCNFARLLPVRSVLM
jgi:hypothetical protein